MFDVHPLGSRKSFPGWVLLISSALSAIANLEGVIQFCRRIGLPDWDIPPYLPWVFAIVGGIYLAYLWYAEQLFNEPIRRILRLSADPAVKHLAIVGNTVAATLTSRNNRIGGLAVEDSVTNIVNLKSAIFAAFDSKSLLQRPKVRSDLFPKFLNEYAKAVQRVIDAGSSIQFNFNDNGNFHEWKRFDSELLSSVRGLISQSGFSSIGQLLENSTWKDGLRNYP